MGEGRDGDSPESRTEELRAQIDRIDRQLLKLLDERGRAAKAIGEEKCGHQTAIYAPDRERNVLERISELNADGVYPDQAVRTIWGEIISATRALESPSSPAAVAYLGPEASFTHMAARKFFGDSSRYVSKSHPVEIFRAVEREECLHGVVPIENSTHGAVVDALDLFVNSSLQICGELEISITQNIMSAPSLELKDVRRVYSHEQAFAQCRAWLQTRLPEADLVAVSSTSEGARMAADEPGAAAIASEMAAQAYGLTILEARIEDLGDNITRFLSIADHAVGPSGDDKTSLFFTVRHEAGTLRKALEPFERGGVSLTAIQSRPSRGEAWEYGFFADMLGHTSQEPIASTIETLRSVCLTVKVLGSYPRLR